MFLPEKLTPENATMEILMAMPFEEAIRRMEAGEDPDKIEDEMGDALDDDAMLFAGSGGRRLNLKAIKKKLLPPRIDETLYDL